MGIFDNTNIKQGYNKMSNQIETNDFFDDELEMGLRPLFVGMPDDWIDQILSITERVKFKKGDYIIKEKIYNDNIYIILKGKADVVITSYEDETSQKIIQLDSSPTMFNLYIGDFIGEVSIVDLESASASVIASTDEVECLKIPTKRLPEILKNNKDLHIMLITNLAKVISRRLRNTNKLLSKYFYLNDQQERSEN